MKSNFGYDKDCYIVCPKIRGATEESKTLHKSYCLICIQKCELRTKVKEENARKMIK